MNTTHIDSNILLTTTVKHHFPIGKINVFLTCFLFQFSSLLSEYWKPLETLISVLYSGRLQTCGIMNIQPKNNGFFLQQFIQQRQQQQQIEASAPVESPSFCIFYTTYGMITYYIVLIWCVRKNIRWITDN